MRPGQADKERMVQVMVNQYREVLPYMQRLVDQMAERGYYYARKCSLRGRRAFYCSGSASPLVFTSWQNVLQYLKECAPDQQRRSAL